MTSFTTTFGKIRQESIRLSGMKYFHIALRWDALVIQPQLWMSQFTRVPTWIQLSFHPYVMVNF